MKFLYANGDSWTYGEEISDRLENDHESTKYYSTWPWYLSQSLDIPVCVNDALGGTSNIRIFRRTNNFINRWIGAGKSCKDLLIIVGWTTPERSEIGEGQGIYPIQIQGPLKFTNLPVDQQCLDNYHKSFYDIYSDSYGEYLTAMYMVNLRLICKGLGIQYYDFIAIGNQPYQWQEYIKTKWNIEIENMYMQGTWSSETKKNQMSVHKYGHPTTDNHRAWANILAKEIA